MGSDLVSLILDVLVLCFLATTIVYVLRLSKTLNNFKAYRKEFDGVITNLLSSINQAERSIKTLKDVSSKEAAELERLISQSRVMAEELDIINEAGENMAKRLEALAEKNRMIVQENAASQNTARSSDKISSPVPFKKRADYASTLKKADKKEPMTENDLPSFMIQDKDFDDMESLESHLDSSKSNDEFMDESISETAEPKSQAEKELLDALESNRRKSSGRGT